MKSKTTAIILAIFLGVFTWLYTYRDDCWKFWTGFGLSIITLGMLGIPAYIWSIIDVVIKKESYYKNYN